MNNGVLITGNLTVQGTTNIGSKLKCAILKDEKSSGTNGGSSVVGVQNRTLNTVTDPYNLVTLDAGNVLFSFNETGVYLIKASATGYALTRNKLYLTDSSNTILLVGTSEYNFNPPGTLCQSTISDILIVTSTSTQYKLRQYAQRVQASTGLGIAVSGTGNEVYAQLVAIKISD